MNFELYEIIVSSYSGKGVKKLEEVIP